MRTACSAVTLPLHRRTTAVLFAGAFAFLMAEAPPSVLRAEEPTSEPSRLSLGRHQFYSGRYEMAAATAQTICAANAQLLDAFELRTSALLFQIKQMLGDNPDRRAALAQCAGCSVLMSEFAAEVARGQALARTRLKADPADESALFLLGRIDLNYVWLQVGTLGRRTGWDESWEARRSLDGVLKTNPGHVRARVARAWIDYIVDTKVPRGAKWLLGGGSRKKALEMVREAASADADFFIRAEAGFALWEMLVREREIPAAVATAQVLARDFPDNPGLTQFLLAQSQKATAFVQLSGAAAGK